MPEDKENPPGSNSRGARSEGVPSHFSASVESTSGEQECRKCRFGLLFIDGCLGCYRCGRHASPDQRELVEWLDKQAPRIGLRKAPDWGWGRAWDWPYGPNSSVPARLRLVEWATAHGLKEARPKNRCALHWLEGRSCGKSGIDCLGHGSDWRDHPTMWSKDGEPHLLLTQPYQVTEKDLEHLERVVSDLRVTGGVPVSALVSEETGWYGYGALWVEVRRGD